MRRSANSVGFDSHVITTQRNPTARLRVFVQERAGFNAQPGTPFLGRKHLQSIGVYLTHFFGCNVRFRILKELGSTSDIAGVAEIVYPNRFFGIKIGIPKGVLK